MAFQPRWRLTSGSQRKCFDAPLQLQELEGIKDMVREHTPGGVRNEGLTETGFLYLHTTFIQRGRLETTWTVLRKFGYAEDMRLTEAFLAPRCVQINFFTFPSEFIGSTCRFDVPYDCSVELSTLGYQFFTDIFQMFDKVCYLCLFFRAIYSSSCTQDQNGALSTAELEDLFKTSPGNPWAGQGFPDTTITDDTGAITLQGWLAQWR